MISVVRMCGLPGCGDEVRARGDLAWSVMGWAGGLAEQEGREGAGPVKLCYKFTRFCGAIAEVCVGNVGWFPARLVSVLVAIGYGGPRR
jgi:hypothetical protein